MKYAGIVIAACILAACQQPATRAPEVSAEELHSETIIQKAMVDDAAEKGGMPRPWRGRKGVTKQFENVAGRIEDAGATLCQEMGLPKQNRRCYYYFHLSRDRDLNAHADGKTITMNLGMMRFLQDDDEVAIVLGHELAHNMMGHNAAKTDNALTGVLLGALADGIAESQGVNSRGSGIATGAAIGALSYSRSFEHEADYVGLYIAARAGYDVSKAAGLWRRMTLEEPDMLMNGYTHPSNPERVAALQKTVKEISNKRGQKLAMLPEMKITTEIKEASPAAGK